MTPEQFAEFKDRMQWLRLLEEDKPLNVYSKQLNVIKQIKNCMVAFCVKGAFHNDEHLLA